MSRDVDSIIDELGRMRKYMDDSLFEYNRAISNVAVGRTKLRNARRERDDALEAGKIVQAVAQIIQERAHKRISDVVTRCMRAVFPKPYELKILFEQKRGKTEARLVFVRNGKEIDPMHASGGGTVDVAAFALRLAALMLSKPQLSRVLFLDEPFKFVSKRYRPAVAAMVEELQRELGVQFVFVSHQDEMKIGKVIELQ